MIDGLGVVGEYLSWDHLKRMLCCIGRVCRGDPIYVWTVCLISQLMGLIYDRCCYRLCCEYLSNIVGRVNSGLTDHRVCSYGGDF